MEERLTGVPGQAVDMEADQMEEGAEELLGLTMPLEMAQEAKRKQLLLVIRHARVQKTLHCLV